MCGDPRGRDVETPKDTPPTTLSAAEFIILVYERAQVRGRVSLDLNQALIAIWSSKNELQTSFRGFHPVTTSSVLGGISAAFFFGEAQHDNPFFSLWVVKPPNRPTRCSD